MAAAVGSLSVLLLCSVAFTSADGSQDCSLFAAIGQTYEIPLDYDLQGKRLTWKHNSKTVYDSKLLSSNTREVRNSKLILTKVTKGDEGKYMADIVNQDTGASVHKTTHTLCVQGNVSKPTVTFKCDAKFQNVKFTCSVKQSEGLTYKWFNGDEPISNKNAELLIQTASVGTKSFMCKVSNSVSSSTSNPVSQDCLKTMKQPSADEENSLFGLEKWVMVSILATGGGLVLVLIVATIICCTKNRKKRHLHLKEEQELRLQWSTSNQQHQRHHSQFHTLPAQDSPQVAPTRGRPAAAAGHTGPRPHKAGQNRPRPPDPITGQPLPGPRLKAQTPKQTEFVNDKETPPPLPQPRKKVPRTQRAQNV